MNEEEAQMCRMRGWSEALWALMNQMFIEDPGYAKIDVLNTIEGIFKKHCMKDDPMYRCIHEAWLHTKEDGE